ncbi:MAG TPA: class I SAM-dependent methyltransferase [Anaerolineae bacterium]|nr:class I SAM-dependent methyltransferase [Anaerolineae bacterium]
MHEANRRYWDALSPHWKSLRDRDRLWERCPREPDLAFEGGALALMQTCCGDLADRAVCVIGSGDNYAAFALAGLGACVTSTDISQGQLEVARERAQRLGLAMEFVRADAADLAPLPAAAFDLVCSTNGFFVWIAQPARVFAAVQRVLKPGGCYVFYDVHPFQRPWRDQVDPIQMAKSYWDVGPYTEVETGACEFNWTLADLLNPLAEAGLVLRQVLESPAKDARFWEGHSYEAGVNAALMDWQVNPRAGLPVWLTVCAQKVS